MLREGKHESWEKIASKVVNLHGEHPCWGTVRNIVSEFNVSRGHRQYKYEKSGRKPWKLPPDVQSYIIRRMLSSSMISIMNWGKRPQLATLPCQKIYQSHGFT